MPSVALCPRRLLVLTAALLSAALIWAEDAAPRLRPGGIDGAVMLVGDGEPPKAVKQRFVELAGGEKAKLVIVVEPKSDEATVKKTQEEWEARKPAAVSARPVGDPKLSEALRSANGVWLSQPIGLPEELKAMLQRGGVVAGVGKDAIAFAGSLLPATTAAAGDDARKLAATGRVGVAVEERTALVIKGRNARVLGEGKVHVALAAGAGRPAKTLEWKIGTTADLNTLVRSAIVRTEAPFPPKEAPVPEVASGSLVIVGGGGMPAEVTQKFIDLAGGPDALIVVLPISMPDPIAPGSERFLRRAGAKNVAVIPVRELADVDSASNLELLRKAGGVWFGGGRQWHFVDAYAGAKFEQELRNVLKRGGVIGGSSAGASIQGDYLCRGDPLGPNPIMCEGYERGLGYLPGVGIDQHFTQRKRQPDMTKLMAAYPQLLGIGLDEATAIIVTGHVAEVMGRGKAHFYDRRKPTEAGQPDFEAFAAGARYDLKERKALPKAAAAPASAATFIDAMPARGIGPATTGGRITAVVAVESDPRIIWVGTAGGGVWKTTNGGDTWTPVFDREDIASIGDIAIAPSNPNIVYAGTGESNPRNSVSWGDGVYKTTDGGRTWEHIGLKETRHIGRIVVHPKNPDIVYVAAIGHLWAPNKERGLYKTTDGGKTWSQSKFIDDATGFVDVAMDPSDPETLYAASYHVRRDGFAGGVPFIQWGLATGLYKTSDGGKTWKRMTGGLPDRPLGRCGLAISRSNPNVVYAIVQTDLTSPALFGQAAKPSENADIGGVFRSDDKGNTWKKLNDLCPRPFYFGQIRVDPVDDRRIYVLGIALHISEDGGKTFPPNLGAPFVHMDHHALWIDPKDPKHLILGNDGGLYFSKNQAQNWEPAHNLPIGQFYSVAVDMRQPYRVYGGLQDNGSWGGLSATRSANGIAPSDWRRIVGGDGFQCAVDPTDPTTVYAEAQWGRLQRLTLGGKVSSKPIAPKPADRNAPPYRFNWNTPLLISPHDPQTLYYGGNCLFKSTDRGDKWEAISPDLTRGRPAPFTFGHTLTTIAESPLKAGLLWVGADDGRVHVSRNGGENWSDVSDKIPGAPKDRWITRIECSHFDEGTAYLTLDRHRQDDLRPYIFKTTDHGETWQPLANNLPAEEPVQVMRESSKNRDLLFAGTEMGLYVSLDGGAQWRRYRGMPTTPVYDLVIHPRERELVVGTHGRSIYIVDIAPLEEVTAEVRKSEVHLFAIRPAILVEPKKSDKPPASRAFYGTNPPFGAVVQFYLRAAPIKPAAVTISDDNGKTLATLPAAAEAGVHRRIWNLHAGEKLVEPGEYTVTLEVDGKRWERKIEVKKPAGEN